MPKSNSWIVKVGGSLAEDAALPACLGAIQAWFAKSIIVPGGGRFVTTTQELQTRWGFLDHAAHVMAILGMAQYGWMLSTLAPGITRAIGLAALNSHATSLVWIPTFSDIESMYELPADWSVSADSIALWVAHYVGAAGLILLKSAPPHDVTNGVTQLIDQHYIDPHFAQLLPRVNVAAHWVTQAQLLSLEPAALDATVRVQQIA
jgi:aspartokinase-like uncharacterized kinase